VIFTAELYYIVFRVHQPSSFNTHILVADNRRRVRQKQTSYQRTTVILAR